LSKGKLQSDQIRNGKEKFLGRSASGPIGPPLFHFYVCVMCLGILPLFLHLIKNFLLETALTNLQMLLS
jgi:hypothetical protein